MTVFLVLFLGYLSAKTLPCESIFFWIQRVSILLLLFTLGISATESLRAGIQVSIFEVSALFIGITVFALAFPALYMLLSRRSHE